MKFLIVFFALFSSCRLAASGYEYSVHSITPSHAPTYATADFKSANIKIQSSLLRDDLILRVEVFVIPAGPGYEVLIGKKEPKVSISDKETEYILSEVRTLLIDAKRERDAKAAETQRAHPISHSATPLISPKSPIMFTLHMAQLFKRDGSPARRAWLI